METTKQKKTLLLAVGIYAILFLVLLLISNFDALTGWLSRLLDLFRPLLIGLVVAYLCNPFFRFFERKLFVKIKPASLRRGISLFFTYLVVLLIIAILLMLIVPQLIQSIVDFIDDADANIDKTVSEVNNLIQMLNSRLSPKENGEPAIPLLNADRLKESASNFFKTVKLDSKELLKWLKPDLIFSAIDVAQALFKTVTDIIFGLFISLYLLQSKEKAYAQIIRLRKVLFSDETNVRITKVCQTADRSFGGFIKGKMLDSTMVGILVYFALLILDVPYEILIAVIIGVTDFVPVIGPFIGVIPSAIIILLTDPGKVIPFLLCILIVQQIDGNIIAPKILGENTGVSSLCVMIAITTMGAIWGLVGMVIGVPLFATVLELTSDYLDKRLEKKGLRATEDLSLRAAEDAEETNQTIVQRLQAKKRVRLEQRAVGGAGDLDPMERFQIETYLLAQKYNVFSKKNATIPEGFVEEENELTSAIQEQLTQEEAPAAEAEDICTEDPSVLPIFDSSKSEGNQENE